MDAAPRVVRAICACIGQQRRLTGWVGSIGLADFEDDGLRSTALICLVPLLALAVSGCSVDSLATAHSTASLSGKPKAGASAETAEVATAAIDMAAPDVPVLAYAAPASASSNGLDGLVIQYAALYGVPESLVRRIIVRESRYNPAARNGPYWGLMQIRHDTARSMGYNGPASGLLDAETNLKYSVKYLSGAYVVGGGNPDQAVRNYARGYYYDAKRQGLLEEVGLR
jgi:soluble lytic murein transglycosylase-like protein